MLDHSLYLEDCRKVGVLPGPGPEDLQEEQKETGKKQKNTILLFFIIAIFTILTKEYIPTSFDNFDIVTLLIEISLLALNLRLEIARR